MFEINWDSIILNFIFIFLFPLFFIGIINRVKSVWAGRKGPSVFQPFYDFNKLLNKGEIISSTTTFVFKITPNVILASIFTAALFVPVGTHKSIISFNGDFIMFAYLLAAGRFFGVIGAMDTGSSFEGMGASREISFSTLAEPAFFIVISTIIFSTGHENFNGIFGLLKRTHEGTVLVITLCAIALFIMMLIEGCRVPVDDPNTHLELTMIHEVMILDNSGPGLAFITYASGLKMVLFGSIIANLIISPAVNPEYFTLLFLIILSGLAVLIGFIESVMARMRMPHIPQFTLMMISIGLLILSITVLGLYGGLNLK
ncbi:NADH-quinone oxidoreductase subunit H [Candidatus Dependentiae bacterium]|nr:NADH-quinone oxidoreductase subunit H [Candidatus Dependentiae bacterium]